MDETKSDISAQSTLSSVFPGFPACGHGKYLEASDDGVVTCSAIEISDTPKFAMDDINNALVRNEALTGTRTTLSDTVLSIFNQIMPANIMAAFVSKFRCCYFVGRLGGRSSAHAGDAIGGVAGCDRVVHMFVLVPVVFVLITRQNPFRFMRQMLPAYVYSLGCSSSMATMPMSLQCIETSREVLSPVMHFVLSVDISPHMPGTAIYLAVLVHFIADVAGIDHAQSVSTMLVAFLGAFLCTAMAPPISLEHRGNGLCRILADQVNAKDVGNVLRAHIQQDFGAR
ncbi:unnamed protein product [Peronospora destructor]|uniref:Amino acid transporter n=1 Tax=Peronospora destructor TaxID=86335 RepID=A0AAV0TZX5_9STRA|nr:unnamed protein product [Peronospora destructor]